MGMYDSVFAKCITCGKQLEFQSKAGRCDLKRYKHNSVPAEIAKDLTGKYGDTANCCGKEYKLTGHIPRVYMSLVVLGSEDEEWD